jgi:hypothetical protein
MPDPVCAALLAKIQEQVERADHLIGLLPDSALEWAPPFPGAWPASTLLGHLLDCLAGFCAVLYAVDPVRLAHFANLRSLPVNHRCGKEEAKARISVYRDRIDEGFGLLHDPSLSRALPTVFAAAGEPVITLLLGNLEHLISHKYQLFTYLKLIGVDAASRDLYHFRT